MDFTVVAQIFDVLHIAPPSKLVLLEARTLASAHVPPYPPDVPALLTGLDGPELAAHVKDVLLTTYPKEHVVYVVEEDGKKEERLSEISVEKRFALYIPALGEGTSFESFAEIVAHLRAPNG